MFHHIHSTKEAHSSFPKVTFKKQNKKQTYYITSAKQNAQTRIPTLPSLNKTVQK